MDISNNGLQLLKELEAPEGQPVLKAYKDSAGIWTIGYGTIQYPNETPVREYDTCTPEEADNFLLHDLDSTIKAVNDLVEPAQLSPSKFDALICLCYNIGIGAFSKSTVLKLVKNDPNDPFIRDAFMMWNKATVNDKKVVIQGLVNRRLKEAEYYFSSL